MTDAEVILAAMSHHARQHGQTLGPDSIVSLGTVDAAAEDMRMLLRFGGAERDEVRSRLADEHPKAKACAGGFLAALIQGRNECQAPGCKMTAYFYVQCSDVPMGIGVVLDRDGLQQSWFLAGDEPIAAK